jgi:hypothetical protein
MPSAGGLVTKRLRRTATRSEWQGLSTTCFVPFAEACCQCCTGWTGTRTALWKHSPPRHLPELSTIDPAALTALQSTSVNDNSHWNTSGMLDGSSVLFESCSRTAALRHCADAPLVLWKPSNAALSRRYTRLRIVCLQQFIKWSRRREQA